MTSRRNNAVRIEAEIEKSREDANWKKVIELSDQLKTRTPGFECLSNFLIGEGKLESYLEENPPIEANFAKATSGLNDAKKFLLLAANNLGRKAGVFLDAHLLLGKLHYACGMYAESLENYYTAELHKLHEKELPLRSLHIVAESFAIKGLCLEKIGSQRTSRYKQAESEEELIRSFELAADLGLLYLQRIENMHASTLSSILYTTSTIPPTTPTITPKGIGPALTTALQHAPILHIRSGKIENAIERYRLMLMAVESGPTQSVRLTLARQLAEVLLRGVSGSGYKPPTQAGKGSSEGPWKPRKYAAPNQFTPKNENEETILLLLISEALAVRDAVLSQSPECREARNHALGKATAIYDLLTIATVRWGQTSLLHDSFERAIKFSFKERHVWTQHSLALGALGRHTDALSSLREVIDLAPDDPTPCLLAARICYEHNHQFEEGLQFSREAVKRSESQQSRALIYEGIGLQLLANTTYIKAYKEKLHRKALAVFERAVHQDPNDHLAFYYLALECALLGQISVAMHYIKISLLLQPESCPALHLFALLLTASQRHQDALHVLESALREYPDNLNLLYVKANLELYLDNGEAALETVHEMLVLWRFLYETQVQENVDDHRSDSRSVLHMHSSQLSDKDSSSLATGGGVGSLAATKVEQAMSEAASSLSSFSPQQQRGGSGPGGGGAHRVRVLQLKIWLLLAEVYLYLDQPEAAEQCVHESACMFPLSHDVMHARGRVAAHRGRTADARTCYANAAAVNPTHAESLRELGRAQHALGSHRLAEKTFRDAARIDPRNPRIWYGLGKVLEALDDHSAASDCMATALEVERASPVVPFSSMPPYFD